MSQFQIYKARIKRWVRKNYREKIFDWVDPFLKKYEVEYFTDLEKI